MSIGATANPLTLNFQTKLSNLKTDSITNKTETNNVSSQRVNSVLIQNPCPSRFEFSVHSRVQKSLKYAVFLCA